MKIGHRAEFLAAIAVSFVGGVLAAGVVAVSTQKARSKEPQNAVAIMVTDPPKNFGRPISVQGRVVFDGEAPIFISTGQSAAYWLAVDPAALMSNLRPSSEAGHLRCIEVRGIGRLSQNLISRHAFINHRAIRFERLELGAVEPNCVLSSDELALVDTEI